MSGARTKADWELLYDWAQPYLAYAKHLSYALDAQEEPRESPRRVLHLLRGTAPPQGLPMPETLLGLRVICDL